MAFPRRIEAELSGIAFGTSCRTGGSTPSSLLVDALAGIDRAELARASGGHIPAVGRTRYAPSARVPSGTSTIRAGSSSTSPAETSAARPSA